MGKHVMTIVMLLIIISQVTSSTQFSVSDDVSISGTSRDSCILHSSYSSHNPIIIDSNNDFIVLGFLGDGTYESPYIIEGLEITGSVCIDISYTTVNFEIRNCLLTANEGSGYGVRLNELQNATIKDCIIDVTFCTGVLLDYVFNCSVLGNEIYSSSSYGSGIIADNLHTGLISNNIVSVDDGDIHIASSTNVSILGNLVTGRNSAFRFVNSEILVISNNSINQGGFLFDGHLECYPTDVSNNFVNGLPFGYFVNVNDIEIDGSLFGQIVVAKSSDVRVIGGVFNKCTRAVQIAWSSDCVVEGVRASWNREGITLTDSNNCAVVNCSIINNDVHSSYGIQLVGSDNCTITGCEVAFLYNGVEIMHSSFSNVTGCKIYSNYYGINIHQMGNSIDNKIWGNRLGWNDYNARDGEPTTSWDDGVSIGNRWSDYSGSGVYIIDGDGGTEDRFPTRLIDNDKPVIDHPEDIYYEEGVQEYYITWHASDSYPYWYRIIRHPSEEGPWMGNQIICNVTDYVLGEHEYTTANLPWGVFNITIIVSDGAGNQIVDSVLIYSILFTETGNQSTTTYDIEATLNEFVTLLAITGSLAGIAIIALILIYRRRSS